MFQHYILKGCRPYWFPALFVNDKSWLEPPSKDSVYFHYLIKSHIGNYGLELQYIF